MEIQQEITGVQGEDLENLRKQLEADYYEWTMQADIYFAAEDFVGAFGALNMAAKKAQQLEIIKGNSSK